MSKSPKLLWQTYLMEFFGLGGFVLCAGLITIVMEHPDLPVMKSGLQHYAMLRRIPLGIIMGIYIAIVILLAGKKSGAHINPAATWTFYRLGKINFKNAISYTIAQFAGAVAAAQFLKYVAGDLFSHPIINYGNTEPRPPHGIMTAFIAEFVTSFILMLLILMASSSKRFEKYVPLISGSLITLYLIVEIPFSGMSLNPARSFAGAFAANQWGYLWIYFVSPTLAMLAAGEIFLGWKEKKLEMSSRVNHPAKIKVVAKDYKEIPNYPVEKRV